MLPRVCMKHGLLDLSGGEEVSLVMVLGSVSRGFG